MIFTFSMFSDHQKNTAKKKKAVATVGNSEDCTGTTNRLKKVEENKIRQFWWVFVIFVYPLPPASFSYSFPKSSLRDSLHLLTVQVARVRVGGKEHHLPPEMKHVTQVWPIREPNFSGHSNWFITDPGWSNYKNKETCVGATKRRFAFFFFLLDLNS